MTRKSLFLIWYISLLTTISCSHSKDKYDYYNRILAKAIGHKPVKEIYVLTDNHCHGCNVLFSQWLRKKINDSTSLLIINADISQLDLSAFQNKSEILFHFHPRDTFFQSSKIIFWEKGYITWETKINVKTVQFLEKPEWLRKVGNEF